MSVLQRLRRDSDGCVIELGMNRREVASPRLRGISAALRPALWSVERAMQSNGGRPVLAAADGEVKEIVGDLAYMRDRIANLFFWGPRGAGDGEWTLIDTGIYGSTTRVLRAAANRFGGSRPAAIILTHGHFDHIGGVRQLAERWDVPVYAHTLEMPYLTGRSSYPPPDPTVGGGAMARMAMLYPRGPIDLGDRVLELPADRSVPGMPEWRWVPTPGHTAGHVSLFRDRDRVLIAGDAFVTTKQESLMAVLGQRQEIHGPPMYYTPDWASARDSVERLAALDPTIAATGHGPPMAGPLMLEELRALARNFDRLAMPERGRYVRHSAITDANGVVRVPPPVPDPIPKIAAAVAVIAAAKLVSAAMRRRAGGDQPS